MRLIICTAFLVVLGWSTTISADPSPAVAKLMSTIEKACKARDLDLIKSCYDFDGVSTYAIDLSLAHWQENWNTNGDTHWVFDHVEFKPLDELLADKSLNQRGILPMLQPHKLGEHVYEPNLIIIGFVTTQFKTGKSSIGMVEPVGIGADGTAKIVSERAASESKLLQGKPSGLD